MPLLTQLVTPQTVQTRNFMGFAVNYFDSLQYNYTSGNISSINLKSGASTVNTVNFVYVSGNLSTKTLT
jgi:hypothetical protein